VIVSNLLLANIVWNVVLCIAFVWDNSIGKAVFYLGATIVTIGIYIME